MANSPINEARLRRIRDRQWEDRWGVDYTASIWATSKEAPGWTSASVLNPLKLGCRNFHTLGRREEYVAYLALHHPLLWDLHEQRALFPEPRAHFLFGHPRAAGMNLSPITGTIAVASRMGFLSKHPKIYVKPGGAAHLPYMVPFPYISDLLLYLEDEAGVYAINWSVTDKRNDYFPRGRRRAGNPGELDEDERDSKLIEKAYYEDAGIRTQKVAGQAVDFDLRCNLRELFLHQNKTVGLPREQIIEITAKFRAAVGSGVVGYEVTRDVAVEFKIAARGRAPHLEASHMESRPKGRSFPTSFDG